MSVDSDGESSSAKMMRWALEHPEEWDVVLGFTKADFTRTMFISKQLREAGFTELPELMAMRGYRLLSPEDGGSS